MKYWEYLQKYYLSNMKVVEKIKKPIYNEMELFEEKFTESMSSKVALLNRITHFIVNRKGKQGLTSPLLQKFLSF